MTTWFFLLGAQGWEGLDWQEEAGNPPGCLRGNAGFDSGEITGLADPVEVGNPFSARVRVVQLGEIAIGGDVTVEIAIGSSEAVQLGFADRVYPTNGVVGYDSGWLLISGTINTAGTADNIVITITGPTDAPGYVYIDTVYFKESEITVGEAVFYQGINSLTERFTLPFDTVAAPNLAMRQDGGIVIGNGGTGEDEIVITTGPGTSYTEYVDVSYDHVAEAIKRVLFIK